MRRLRAAIALLAIAVFAAGADVSVHDTPGHGDPPLFAVHLHALPARPL